MIGNDIVDLQLAGTESNWQRKGWLNKLFSDREQQYILASEKPQHMVWLLWSMKEAAYKITNRMTKERRFAPLTLQCHLSSAQHEHGEGFVLFENDRFYTFSSVSADYVHTIATIQNNLDGIAVYIREAHDSNTKDFKDYFFLKDEDGIPFLQSSCGRKKVVSKSHHGRYEAVVC